MQPLGMRSSQHFSHQIPIYFHIITGSHLQVELDVKLEILIFSTKCVQTFTSQFLHHCNFDFCYYASFFSSCLVLFSLRTSKPTYNGLKFFIPLLHLSRWTVRLFPCKSLQKFNISSSVLAHLTLAWHLCLALPWSLCKVQLSLPVTVSHVKSGKQARRSLHSGGDAVSCLARGRSRQPPALAAEITGSCWPSNF